MTVNGSRERCNLTKINRRFDPWLLQSVGWDYKPRSRLHMTLAVGGTLNHNQTSKPTRKHTPLPDQIIITPICIPTYANILQILPYHTTANILRKYICMQSAHTLANMNIISIFDTCKRGLIFVFATCLHMFER